MEKRKLVFLLLISIITIFATIVGVTLVYLSSQITVESNIRQTIIETKSYPITITYNKNSELKLDKSLPNSSDSLDLIINNLNPKDSITYYLYWTNINNSFDLSLKELSYSVTCKTDSQVVNQISEKPLSLIQDNEIITQDIELLANATNTCAIELNLISNLQSPNNTNQSFSGMVKVGIR